MNEGRLIQFPGKWHGEQPPIAEAKNSMPGPSVVALAGVVALQQVGPRENPNDLVDAFVDIAEDFFNKQNAALKDAQSILDESFFEEGDFVEVSSAETPADMAQLAAAMTIIDSFVGQLYVDPLPGVKAAQLEEGTYVQVNARSTQRKLLRLQSDDDQAPVITITYDRALPSPVVIRHASAWHFAALKGATKPLLSPRQVKALAMCVSDIAGQAENGLIIPVYDNQL